MRQLPNPRPLNAVNDGAARQVALAGLHSMSRRQLTEQIARMDGAAEILLKQGDYELHFTAMAAGDVLRYERRRRYSR